MRPATVAELAERYGVPAPQSEPDDDFGVFLAAYDGICDLIRSPDDLRRLFLELAEDGADEDCVWLEPHVFPPLLSRHLGDPVGVLELMVDAATQAARAVGVGIGLLLSADRSRGPADALRWAKEAARWAGRGVTTFGLAGDEARYPPGPFREAFAAARDAGLLAVPHAGELAGPHSVRQALTALRPDRLAHGVRIVEDAGLVAAVRDGGVVCDVCPTSNVTLGLYRSLAAHPLPRLLSAGVLVSLNADDPVLFDTSIGTEYERARDEIGLSDEQLAEVARVSVEWSAAPADIKRAARDGIAAWLSDG